STPSMRIAAVPSSTMWRPDPVSPWRRTFSPSANHCSVKTSTTFSRCGVVRSANRANPAIVSASSPTAMSRRSDQLVRAQRAHDATRPESAGLGPSLLLTPGVERVIKRHLRLQLFVVALAVEAAEPHGDRLQARGLGRQVDVSFDVGAVHDF